MYSLSRAEIEGKESVPFNPAEVGNISSEDNTTDIFRMIVRGGILAPGFF